MSQIQTVNTKSDLSIIILYHYSIC